MVFGEDNFACTTDLNDGTHEVLINANHVDVNDWLVDTYFRTDPLVNVEAGEGSPIIPTHIKVVIDRTEFYRPIMDWNKQFIVDFKPNASCNVDIFWIKETATGNLELGETTLNMYVNK
jgi:hypothetical protein